MASQQVKTIRSFNRAVTHRLGVLDDSFLGRGRPLSEARLLYEIGVQGAEVRDLRARLSLDSGYLSRLLRSLERQHLVKSNRAVRDSRVVTARLTRQGLLELRELERLSNAFARSMLQSLGENHRDRLVKAMNEVERLMQASAVKIAIATPQSIGARHCLGEYFRELGRRFTGGFQASKSISAELEEFRAPSGVFLVATLNGRAVGCGGLKFRDHRIGEIARLWVAPDVRGLGIGSRILGALERHARHSRRSTLRLDTNEALTEAQRLYRLAGYREISRFNDNPYAHHWFEKTGQDAAGPRRSLVSAKCRARQLQRRDT